MGVITQEKESLQRAVGANTVIGALSSTPFVVENIEALRAVVVDKVPDGTLTSVAGYATTGDGGGGTFYYSAASAVADNDGTIIEPDSGSGRWLRVVNGALNVKWFGAKGDGSTDDTLAIQACINAGSATYFPGVDDYYKATEEILVPSNHHLFGDGEDSQIRQATTLLDVLRVDAGSDIIIENVLIYACGTVFTREDGCGISVRDGSARVTVRGVHVKNHRGFGVMINDSTDCLVGDNTFTDSPVSNSDNHTQAGADVAFMRSCKRCIARGNMCNSGQGVGIYIQTLDDADLAEDNIVEANTVYNTKQYGIMAYRIDGASSVTGTVINGNTVRNVSGAVQHATFGYIYGTGIYVQGAERTIVSNNNVKNTHSAAVVWILQLAPAAITAVNLTRVSILGNVIDTDGICGIWVDDVNGFGVADGNALVEGNEVYNVATNGIRVNSRARVKVAGNTVDTTINGRGILVLNSVTQRRGISIVNNDCRNIGGVNGYGFDIEFCDGVVVANNSARTVAQSGFTIFTCDNATLVGNFARSCGLHGFTLTACNDFIMTGNNMSDMATRGIQIVSSCARGLMDSNVVRGNGSTVEGIRIDAATTLGENMATNCVTNYAGSFVLPVTIASAATITIPFVGCSLVNITGTTNITGITAIQAGVEVTLVFAGILTVTDGGNLKLNGNFVTSADDTMTLVSDGTNWIEKARSAN